MALDGVAKIECQLLAVDGRQNGASPYSLPVAHAPPKTPAPHPRPAPALSILVGPAGAEGNRPRHTEVGQRRGKDGNGSA